MPPMPRGTEEGKLKISTLIVACAVAASIVLSGATAFAQAPQIQQPGLFPGQTLFDGMPGYWTAPGKDQAVAILGKQGYGCDVVGTGLSDDKRSMLVWCRNGYVSTLFFEASISKGAIVAERVKVYNYDLDKNSRPSSDLTSPAKPFSTDGNANVFTGPKPDDAKKIAQEVTGKMCREYTGIKQQQRETIIYCDHFPGWQVSTMLNNNKLAYVVDMQSGQVMQRK
jgi:hypothetical protein